MGNSFKSRREKIKLKCYFCHKIVKNPVELPCGCASICNEHILQKTDLIKCQKCKVIFDFESMSKEKFETNLKMIQKLASSQHLSRKERRFSSSFTQQLEKMRSIYETINRKILEFPYVQYEHFYELRNRIDIERETSLQNVISNEQLKNSKNLIEKIHKLSAQQLEQVNLNEIKFRDNYNEKKSLVQIEFDYDNEELCLNELFRDTNLNELKLKNIEKDFELKLSSMQHKLDVILQMEFDLKQVKIVSHFTYENLLKRQDLLMVSSDVRCEIDIWDMSVCLKVKTLQGHTRPVTCLISYIDENKLLSGSDDGLIKVWCTIRYECFRTLKGHKSGVHGLKMVDDKNQRLASVSYDKTIKIWCLNEFVCLLTLNNESNRRVSCLERLENDILVSGFYEGCLKIWDLNVNKKIKLKSLLYGHLKMVKCLTGLFGDGCLFASGSWDRTIKIWCFPSGVCLRTLHGHKDFIWNLIYVSELNVLVSGGWDKSIRIWNLSTFQCEKAIEMSSPLKYLGYDSCREYLMCGLFDKIITFWSLNNELNDIKCQHAFQTFSPVNCFVLMEN